MVATDPVAKVHMREVKGETLGKMSVTEMHKVVRSLPKYGEKLKMHASHTKALEQCLTIFKEMKLGELATVRLNSRPPGNARRLYFALGSCSEFSTLGIPPL
mmetsp:Transcript_15120/g.38716  ORF Transcript_15120/g.38716 Transcript_15120/m.38716 type:complete len:102 (+) Transcript_15120:110-415(+)